MFKAIIKYLSFFSQKADDQSIKRNELLPLTKHETSVSTSPVDQEVVEYSPDGATVIQRTIKVIV